MKKISDQAAIRATRVEFFSKINKRPWSFIRDRRVQQRKVIEFDNLSLPLRLSTLLCSKQETLLMMIMEEAEAKVV